MRFLANVVTLSTVGPMMHKNDFTKLLKLELEP